MKLKVLEKMINERIENELKEEMSFYDTTNKVERIVSEIIKESGWRDKNIYTSSGYGTRGNIQLRYSGDNATIEIKVRRKKGDYRYERYYGYTQYYFVNKVEIEETDLYDSIQGFIDYIKECKKAHEEYKIEKKKNFMNKMEELGLEFKDFVDLYKTYKNMDYSDREQIAKDYVGNEEYYKYIY